MDPGISKSRVFRKHYLNEKLHFRVYGRLASLESNPDIRRVMKKLSALEESHARLWKMIISEAGMGSSEASIKAKLILFGVVRRLFGLAFTIKALEYSESNLTSKLSASETELKLTGREAKVIRRIKSSERSIETPLENKVIEYNSVLNNIRDVIFGMNDGLVEVLAATVGLAAALQRPHLVLLGGLIIAVSGTLSMAGGAYLSTGYEKAVRAASLKKAAHTTPLKSALYVGAFYILGAIFPLLPFAAGASGTYGIALSLILTSAVLSVTATVIAVISGISIRRNVLKSLAISLGAAVVTIIIGAYARIYLHLAI